MDPSVFILVGNHPRVHLLMSFEPQPQLYTLIGPTLSVNMKFKGKVFDRSGGLHPYSHLWRSHNARGQLRWALRLLRRNTEQQPHAPAVEPVVLPLAEAQMGQKSATEHEQYQSLLNIWRVIKEAEEVADDQERISWLIEVCITLSECGRRLTFL
ncbi:hypothetical protein FRC11_006604 [Ceratobasidium sp. 423]|nr:hypothetical protein FRC11_006604 [Ceratobasidium sp. 423]